MIISLHTNGSGQNGTATVAVPSRTASKKKLIPHREAFRVLFSSMSSERLSENVRAELPAVISHWLQCPAEDPLIIDRAFGAKWRTQLSVYARTPRTDFIRFKSSNPKPQIDFQIDFSDVPFPSPARSEFTFIDLFAGIGGFRIGLQNLGGGCVFSSEWDHHAKLTYAENFGEIPFGDIHQFTQGGEASPFQEAIPKHDILVGGFPCQAFSQAGRQLGFEDARGTLFFEILTIAKKHQPRALILENVKRLKTHDRKRTFFRHN